MPENRVLRGIYGQKRDEIIGGRRKRILRSFIICILHQTGLERSSQGG
jgi:hypothetical protein